MRLTRSNALSKHPIFLIIIGFRITMVNETCIFCGFKRSKCLKGCFYLWITLIKKTTRVHMRCTMLIAI
jgi:hypothetical protein